MTETSVTYIPKIKLSENPVKITNPGDKTVFRIYDKETGKIKADLIAFADEHIDENQPLHLFDPTATWKQTTLPANSFIVRELLVPVFLNGECVYESPCVMDIRDYCQKELNTLWDETKRFVNPQNVYVDLLRIYKTFCKSSKGLHKHFEDLQNVLFHPKVYLILSDSNHECP